MKDTRFRVRDESGRFVTEIIGDLQSNRGLGVPARTIEGIMDAWSQSHRTTGGVTELYGDVATGEGIVYLSGQNAWPIEALEIAPAAEQILAYDFDQKLEARARVTYLGRPATEYFGLLEGKDNDIPYKSEMTRVVSAPYLLFSNVRDSRNADYYLTREVVQLEEGAVTDLDLTPP